MMAAIRAQHEASVAAAAERARAKADAATGDQKADPEAEAGRQQQTTSKKKRRQVVAADDGPDENLGRVERRQQGGDALGKVLLFGTGVAVGGMLAK